METDIVFNTGDLDDVSDLPTLHLSTIIHTLLPIRLIEWKAVKRHFESAFAGMQGSFNENMKDIFDIIVTGSAAEGYCLPIVTTRTNPVRMEVLSDVDVLFVSKHIPVSTVRTFESSKDVKAYLDYNGVHPGYTRICVPRIKEEDEVFVFVEGEGKYYLSGTGYMKKMMSTKEQWNLDETTEASVQGPAITLDDHQTLTEANFDQPNAGLSKDLVLALPCSPWPDIANGIRDRTAKSEWLQPPLVESIINDGCHVVAIPSKTSETPELEWRLSFSASEGRLAREAVTDHQRQCYIYLKILRYQVMKPLSVLSSYVFKCVFLLCCERLPVNHWKQYPGNCVFYMLDVLLEWLHKKHVPSYFVPQNNLIGHLSDDELKIAISVVEKLRIDPISPVLDFMDDKMFACHCVHLNFRSAIKPLLDDMEAYKQHRNLFLSVCTGVFTTYYYICVSLLKEESLDKEAEGMKHQEAVRYVIDMYSIWVKPVQEGESLIHFVNSFGLALKDTKLSIRFFTSMVSVSDEYPEFQRIRGNLACMLHSAAYTHEDGSEQRKECLKTAGRMFKQIYEERKESAIDYVTYLIKQKGFQTAEEIVEDILKDEDNIVNTEYVYDLKELETLEDPLKKYVQENGKICGDSSSFAYYYLVKCLCVKEQLSQNLPKVKDLIDKFESYCQKKKKDHLLILLDFTKRMVSTPDITK